MMKKYRKKIEEIEAEQFWPDKKPWPEGLQTDEHGWEYFVEDDYSFDEVSPGDFIVKYTKGYFNVAPERFKMNYEPV